MVRLLRSQSALYVAIDQKYISQTQFEALYKRTDEISKLIMGFSNYLRKSSASSHNSKNSTNSKDRGIL